MDKKSIVECMLEKMLSPFVCEFIRNSVAQTVIEEIKVMEEWCILYEVEEDGEKLGYYQTDWTREMINNSER